MPDPLMSGRVPLLSRLQDAGIRVEVDPDRVHLNVQATPGTLTPVLKVTDEGAGARAGAPRMRLTHSR